MLPKTFVFDFGTSPGDYATFIDPNNNQFEVMVERICGSVFLTTGFNAIRDFYDVRLGGSFGFMVFCFCITLLFSDHFYHMIYFFFLIVVIFMQMLIYKGLCDLIIGKKITSLMIDDCGNKWNYITIFETRPHNHIKLGGGWKRMVQARRLGKCVMVKVGFPHAGMNDIIYIQVKRPTVSRV